ncbi:cytidine deaminase family protein [Sedimentibacter saalensis]|uniref:Cytidine deaminase n=1 Tax=Sedimentibacter saalensis TaxID=130788 RepID=A0A562JFJ5_9FIRM|nr:cytidine deaminase [Sedimentibacter saalensis]TWH81675.1 cytidine deaminase [Sedimentibacter saalensis]
MNTEWQKLYDLAMAVINPHEISKQMYVGSVAAAVLTKRGNIYTGICIDTSSSLGMCAERNAMSTMLANGENDIEKVVAVYKDGTVMAPCGACREFMMQLGESARNIEILLNNDGKSMSLSELMPEYPY